MRLQPVSLVPPPSKEPPAFLREAEIELLLLREAEARMRAILDRAVDGIVTIDEQGRIESFNRSAERMFGYTAAEILGVEVSRLIAFVPIADNDRRWPANLPEADNSVQGVQVEGRRKDGSEVPLEVSLSAVVVGERRLVTALLRDISERRRQERRTSAQQAITKILSQSKSIEEATSGLVAALGSHLGWHVASIWLETPDGAHLHRAAGWRSDPARFDASMQAAESMRFSRGQPILGRVWHSGESLWTEAFPDACNAERSEAARKDGILTSLACPIVVNDSVLGVIEILSTKAIVRDDALVDVIKAFGSQLGQFIERKEAEDALRVAKEAAEQASRAKTDFLANVSHEIRTPLNAILGVADILWESELDDEQRQYMSLFRRAGANLLVLVNDLLDLSKVEAGQLELKKVAFDPREVVAQALESTSVGAYEKGLEMVGRVSLRVPGSVFGDPARLRQVLVNLLSNAVKFTSRGEVLLDVERDPQSPDGGALMFSVRDTGIGIPQDKLDAIFDRFSQVDASLTRVHGGTGLGLAICRRLVDLMGGRIWAESELGSGTTFLVLEITERAPLDNIEDLVVRTAKLRAMGYRLAIDDLGAGYAAMWIVAMLEPEIVKLDMSLVRNIHENRTKSHIVRHLVGMAHDSSALVVAEGIETERERNALVDMGCDFLQGYLLGKPIKTAPLHCRPVPIAAE